MKEAILSAKNLNKIVLLNLCMVSAYVSAEVYMLKRHN